jgi:arylsulfatase A-like enzyme
VDLYPTLLDVAGARPDPDYPLDGVSVTPLLYSDGTAKLDRKALYWHFPGYLGYGKESWRTTPAGAIRVGDWKLQDFFEDNRVELYNLKDDIGERHDLSDLRPEKRDELHRMLRAWRLEIKAPLPRRKA